MAKGFQFTDPNLLGRFSQGLSVGQQFRQQREGRALDGLQRSQALDKASLTSIVQGAQQLKQIRDPQQKLDFLSNRRQQLDQAGINTTQTDEAIQLINEGQFGALEEATDRAIALGQQLSGKGRQGGIKAFAPVETIGAEGQRGLSVPTFDPTTGQAGFEQIPLGQEVELARETAQTRRQAELEAATAKERGKLLANQRQKISSEINKNARESRRQVPRINRLLEGLKAVSTGKIAQAKLILGPLLPGIDPTNEEVLQTQINDLVLDQISRFTGAISEGEREFAKRTVANLGFTREANVLILNNLKERLGQAIKEESQFKDFKRDGGKAEGFEFQIEAPAEAKDSSATAQGDVGALSDEELLNF